MTEDQFAKEIARLSRRVNLLKLARSGSVEVRRVRVKQYRVRAHMVRSHTRVYYTAKER